MDAGVGVFGRFFCRCCWIREMSEQRRVGAMPLRFLEPLSRLSWSGFVLAKRKVAESLLHALVALKLVVNRDTNKRATRLAWEVAVVGKRCPVGTLGVFAIIEIQNVRVDLHRIIDRKLRAQI